MKAHRNSNWFFDNLSPEEGHIHGIKNILYSGESEFQSMEILETWSYGKCLILDGKMQSSEVDEFIYHEALVHPAMLTHPKPESVFIVGGGEGATLREVLRHKTVKRAVMVDIDKEVVDKCRELLPEYHQGAFDDPRAELLFMDARKYLEDADEKFDVIIIDISEPVEEGPAYLLYTQEFYNIVTERLTGSGIITQQTGTISPNSLLNYTAVNNTLSTVFQVVAPYYANIPSFGRPWGFTLASKNVDPLSLPTEEVDKRIGKRIKGKLAFYDGITHQGAFRIPKYLREANRKQKRVIRDTEPLFAYTA
ncbi:MAG: polyamine aminopropyltransferase [Deltaproteobacteria bacterium]|nr:polyamine aminopropyltransferase [Deltaproteobacteria bacterium]